MVLSLEAERALHARLLAGDSFAPSELADAYLAPLVARLARAYAWVDPHLVETAAIDAVLDTAEHPDRYDPARGSLGTYLWVAAKGDLRNARQKEGRRAAHQAPLEAAAPGATPSVELRRAARNLSTEARDDPAELVARGERLDPTLLATVRAAFDTQEWAVVALMLDGEKRTTEYARLLGLGHLPAREQAREVKRVKDRLKKRLRRLAPQVKRDG